LDLGGIVLLFGAYYTYPFAAVSPQDYADQTLILSVYSIETAYWFGADGEDIDCLVVGLDKEDASMGFYIGWVFNYLV
jgi:hypothetical protein